MLREEVDLPADLVQLQRHPHEYLPRGQRLLKLLHLHHRWSAFQEKFGQIFLRRNSNFSDQTGECEVSQMRIMILPLLVEFQQSEWRSAD